MHVPLLDINPEGKLQREIKDIIDELDIMININKKNQGIIRRFAKKVEHIMDPEGRFKEKKTTEDKKAEEQWNKLNWFRVKVEDLLSDVSDRIDELEGLKKSAESTAQSVSPISPYLLVPQSLLQRQLG